MKKLFALPTWLLIKLLIPFLPISHPWYKKKFTLKDWFNNSRPLNNMFNFIIWFYIILIIILIFKL